MVASAAFRQAFFNVLLFVPLGTFLRCYARVRLRVAAPLALGASLTLELTQLTALWGLLPCAYRVFDVDDLLLNTVGALLGCGIAVALPPLPRAGQRVMPGSHAV